MKERTPPLFSSKVYLISILSLLFFLDLFTLWYTSKLDYDRTLERARLVLQQTSTSLEERVKRTVIATEAILDNRAQRIQEVGIKATIASRKEWEDFRKAAKGLPDAGSLWLLDDKANLLLDSTQYPSQRMSFAEREYYVPQRDKGIELYIGPMVKGKITKKYSFTISRRLNGKDGKFLGIVLAAIETDDFTNFLRNLNIGEGSTVTVFRTDGALILRQPMQDEYLGKTFLHLKLFSMPFDKSPSGIYESSAIDGISRLLAYRKIQRLPLLAATGIPVDSVLQGWRTRLKANSLIATLVFFVLIGLSLIVRKTTSREEKERTEELSELNTSLKESEQRWATTLASIGDAVIATDDAGRITFMNTIAEELTGWKLTDAWMKPILEVFHIVNEKTRREVENPVEKVLREGMIVGLANHTILVRKDGTEVPIDDSGAPIRDSYGKTMGVVLVFRDITERRQAEVALRERERLLQDVIDGSPSAIFLKDLDGKFLTINTRLEKMLGMTREELKGKTDYDIAPKDTADYWRSHDMKVIETGQALQIEEVADLEDGRHIFLANKFPLVDANGKTFGVGSISHDITERKRMEEELRRSRDDLEVCVGERTEELRSAYEDLKKETNERTQLEDALRQSQKMEAVGTLAGGIAHDFNNMLAAIIGFTEMAVEDTQDRPEVVRSLQNVLKSSMRARDLIKQILIFSRKSSYDRSPLSLTPLIKETIQFLRASIPTTIKMDLAITASSDTILASPVEVQQILMNLATNASLAMQERGGTLEIALSDIDFTPESPVLELDVMPGEYVQLTVKDTGIGMTPDVMKRVFEPFFTTREVGKGTGMGLAVVYGIVKDLQGTITVESTPGSGSTFQVFLPKVQASALNHEADTTQAAKGTERVLFIDDEPMLTEWGRTTLTRLGYKVTAVTDSKQALSIFSSDPSQFDLVITDHTMPSMTGVQFSKELLKIKPGIPIILCTGHSETVSPDIAREAGIKEYLMKPMAREEFAQAVRRVLDQKARE
ncbi:MAG TPA: PAS domain S-box protein [Syntrophorhabdaceae bacterium]|nr:PAS domain S-box protein [Syntrophorhabdaceae bacterium]